MCGGDPCITLTTQGNVFYGGLFKTPKHFIIFREDTLRKDIITPRPNLEKGLLRLPIVEEL